MMPGLRNILDLADLWHTAHQLECDTPHSCQVSLRDRHECVFVQWLDVEMKVIGDANRQVAKRLPVGDAEV